MFGAFRCSKDGLNNLEYVDLSGNSSVDARNYTVLACDQCRDRKLKCSGDPYGCQRCQITSSTCTYRSSTRSAEPSSSKRQHSASEHKASSKPPTKRQHTKSNSDCRPTAEKVSSIHVDIRHSLPSVDTEDSFWTAITPSGPALNEFLHDWDDIHSKEPEHPNLNLDESANAPPFIFPSPEIQHTPSYSVSTAVSLINDDGFNGLVMTPPPTANPTATPADLSEYRSPSCGCIRSLADMLERISGDGSDIDEADRFDDLLVYLRDGIKTCKQVLPCKHCSVCATNSMFVVTIVQQLATISQSLCRQLLAYQQKVKTTPTVDVPPFLPNADIYVGKYQVQAAAVHVGCLFLIVSMHLKDLQQLLGHLRNDIKKGTKAGKLLSAAAEVVQSASSDLQQAGMDRS